MEPARSQFTLIILGAASLRTVIPSRQFGTYRMVPSENIIQSGFAVAADDHHERTGGNDEG